MGHLKERFVIVINFECEQVDRPHAILSELENLQLTLSTWFTSSASASPPNVFYTTAMIQSATSRFPDWKAVWRGVDPLILSWHKARPFDDLSSFSTRR